jgi:hypothetical protein
MSGMVTVEINQQQAQLVDRLVASATHGTTRAEVMRRAFVEFCERHPELRAGDNGRGE